MWALGWRFLIFFWRCRGTSSSSDGVVDPLLPGLGVGDPEVAVGAEAAKAGRSTLSWHQCCHGGLEGNATVTETVIVLCDADASAWGAAESLLLDRVAIGHLGQCVLQSAGADVLLGNFDVPTPRGVPICHMHDETIGVFGLRHEEGLDCCQCRCCVVLEGAHASHEFDVWVISAPCHVSGEFLMGVFVIGVKAFRLFGVVMWHVWTCCRQLDEVAGDCVIRFGDGSHLCHEFSCSHSSLFIIS